MIFMFRNCFMLKILFVILIYYTKEVYLENENSGNDVTGSPEESIDATAFSAEKLHHSHPLKNEETSNDLNEENSSKSPKESSPDDTEEKSEKEEKEFTSDTEEEEKEEEEEKATESEPEGTEPSVSEENEKTSEKPTAETPSTEKEKEKYLKDTFAVRDHKGNICILAKFEAVFTITEPETAKVHLPKDASSKGKCNEEETFLKLSWEKFHFRMDFSQIPDDDDDDDFDDWAVTSMEFKFHSKDVFKESEGTGRNVTVEATDLQLFKTELGQSHFCPSAEVTLLTGMQASTKVEANVRMKDVQLQPFDVKDDKFSKAQRCNLVAMDDTEEPFVRDETAPLAVGLTLALLTLFTVLGFSIHRAYTMRKVEYNDME